MIASTQSLCVFLVVLVVLCRYFVFSDPPGAKIGAGGATMYVLQQLEQSLGWDELQKGVVFLAVCIIDTCPKIASGEYNLLKASGTVHRLEWSRDILCFEGKYL